MVEYQWHIVRRGDSTKPPLWLLHGFMGDVADWTGVMEHLEGDYYCCAVDLPGHGRTVTFDHENFFAMPRVADALAEVIEGFGRPVSLAGYSMGGRLALYLAVHYPKLFDAVVIESGSPGLQGEQERRQRRLHDEALAKRLESEPLEQFLTWWYSQPLFATLAADKEQLKQVIARRGRQDPKGLALSLRMMGTGVQPPLWEKLASVSCPMHLIVGENDDKFRQIARRMTEHNSRLTITIIEGAGHNTHEERPEAFTSALRRLLRKG